MALARTVIHGLCQVQVSQPLSRLRSYYQARPTRRATRKLRYSCSHSEPLVLACIYIWTQQDLPPFLKPHTQTHEHTPPRRATQVIDQDAVLPGKALRLGQGVHPFPTMALPAPHRAAAGGDVQPHVRPHSRIIVKRAASQIHEREYLENVSDHSSLLPL